VMTPLCQYPDKRHYRTSWYCKATFPVRLPGHLDLKTRLVSKFFGRVVCGIA